MTSEIKFEGGDLLNHSLVDQITIMKEWFFSKYEDPVNNCPYESRGGGYQYIWGGPYDAEEVLKEKFENMVSEKAIEKLISELEQVSSIWSRRPDNEDYHDYYYDVMAANTAYHGTLTNSLNDISKLLSISVTKNEENLLYRILFVNVITTLETFLAEAFIQTVVENDQLLRTFVGTNPDFAVRKLTLKELFVRADGIKKEVKDYLVDIIWHNLAKVKKMYEDTFDIKINSDLENIYKSIITRHDIVHRNGRTKDGTEIIISESDLRNLMMDVRYLADEIDNIFGV
jgi:hypothetical protein